jgi:hypothetical protein
VEWRSESKENEAVVKSGLPSWAWLTGTGTIIPSASKSGGDPYDILEITTETTQLGVLAGLAQLLQDDEAVEGIRACSRDVVSYYEKNILPKKQQQ